MSESGFDAHRALRGARRAARRVVPDRYAAWREDVAQEVALMVWRDAGKGVRASRRRYLWHAVTASRSLLCWGRNPARLIDQVPLIDDRPGPEANHLAALCRARLRALWPSLTDAQKAGLMSVVACSLHERADAADAFGVSVWSLRNARRRALHLLDTTPVAAAWARRRVP